MVRKKQRAKAVQESPPGFRDNILDRLSNFTILERSFSEIDRHSSSFGNILDDLGRIEIDISQIQEQRPDFQPPRQQNLLVDTLETNDILSELGALIKNCRMCNKEILRHELINGVCFECHNKQELVQEKDHLIVEQEFKFEPLLNRIRELESQVRDLRSKLEIPPFSNNLSILPPINSTPSSSPPPPPPPVPLVPFSISSSPLNDVDFSNMSLDELKSFSPQDLATLSLPQRNQFNLRLKELQDLEQMSPTEKAAYYKRKEQESVQASQISDFKNALKNLEELGNPLFTKMRKQAEESAISGSGTFGSFVAKSRFIPCYSCGETNELTENDEFICQFCQAPLSER